MASLPSYISQNISMLLKHGIYRSRQLSRLEAQFKWWIEEELLFGRGKLSLLMQECCNEEFPPKERHSAEISALLWARDAEFLHLGLERCPFCCAPLNLQDKDCPRKYAGNTVEIYPNDRGEIWSWTL